MENKMFNLSVEASDAMEATRKLRNMLNDIKIDKEGNPLADYDDINLCLSRLEKFFDGFQASRNYPPISWSD
jgi:hypothetical protein